MRSFIQDFRHAARSLASRPGFVAVVVLTLALGIGANGAIFGLVDGVLLRPLPYADADRLLALWTQFPEDGLMAFPLSEAELLEFSAESTLFEAVGAGASGSAVLTGLGDPERVRGAQVTAGLWPTLGVEPLLGRVFTREEDLPGGERLVVLSHAVWQQRFAGDAAVIGRRLTLDGEPHTVIGVMPQGFFFPAPGVEMWSPLALDPAPRSERSGHYLGAVGRPLPGVTLEQVRAEMAAITGRWQESYDHAHPMTAVGLREQALGPVRTPMLVLLGAVGFVLLIACANVAGLLLVRSEGRRREMAVRAALGASRSRLAGHALAESLLLALAGGTAGLLVASLGIDLLLGLDLGDLPRLEGVAVDLRVISFVAALTLVTTLIFGLAPAVAAGRAAPWRAIKQGSGPAARGSARHLARRGLVVGQIAVATVLVIGAGLLTRSLWNLLASEPGFDAGGALTARVELPMNRYPEKQQLEDFFRQLDERMAALPGVEAAGQITAVPLRRDPPVEGVVPLGRELASGEDALTVRVQLISPGTFAALGVPLVKGRALTAADRSRAPRVALVNQTLARALFAGAEPLGERLELLAADPRDEPFTVIGVVGDVRDAGLGEPPRPTLFVAHAQAAHFIRARSLPRSAALVLRTALPPGELVRPLRQAVRELDPGLALYDVQPLAAAVDAAVSRPRLLAALLGVFSAVALLLAAVGVYGLVAQVARQRRREFGVRLALGAGRGDVERLVLGQSLGLAAAGLAAGLVLAFLASRGLAGVLYGVGAADPGSYLAAAAVLAAAALLAGWLPARRASRVDPVQVLRAE